MTLACLLAANTLAWAADDASPSASAPTGAKPVIAMEEPSPGDFWVYETRDEISGTVSAVRTNMVTEVTPTEISVRFTTQGKDGGGLNVYDRTWNIRVSGPWKYQPHDGTGIQSPLKVGTTWKFQSDDVNPGNGAIWKRSGQSKVVGQETVTTRAGTFDTFKVETVMARHPTNDPTRKWEIIRQTWYAPAINHWVKRTFVARAGGHLQTSETLELVEYGRKQ
jgi:hypothetical protein